VRNWLFSVAMFGSLLLSIGCGGNSTTINTTPLTDEQKRQIAENDKQIESEESPGNKTLKGKPGKK
jgi:hypothetical protein